MLKAGCTSFSRPTGYDLEMAQESRLVERVNQEVREREGAVG